MSVSGGSADPGILFVIALAVVCATRVSARRGIAAFERSSPAPADGATNVVYSGSAELALRRQRLLAMCQGPVMFKNGRGMLTNRRPWARTPLAGRRSPGKARRVAAKAGRRLRAVPTSATRWRHKPARPHPPIRRLYRCGATHPCEADPDFADFQKTFMLQSIFASITGLRLSSDTITESLLCNSP